MTHTSSQGKEKEDRGLFLQLPFILIDTVEMSDSAMVGFIRFCRSYLQKDKTIRYSGSYRTLAKEIRQPRTTCYRSVAQWIRSGLIVMSETADEFILSGDLSALWQKNPEHCKTQQRPKLGQISSTMSQFGTVLTSAASQDNLSSVPNINGTIPNRDDSVPNWDTNERKTPPIDTIDTLLDTKERVQGNFVDTSLPCTRLQLLELDPLCEDTYCPPSQEIKKSQKPPEKPNKQPKQPKKEKVVQPLLVENKKAVAFNDAEQQQFDWYCGLDFIRVHPPQDERKKAQCATLIPHVHSQEDMKSLAAFTKKRLEARGIKVYIVELGNMANSSNLNEWLASKQPANVIDFQQPRKRNFTFERIERERAAAQERAAIGG